MARLFLSYRRSDTGAYADRLAQRLMSFQFESVFQDRESIQLGDNFADRLRSELSQCSVVLVLIGPNWIDVRDAAGRRRLEDPSDWVRREVALALSLKLLLVPVFFDSPPRLSARELPGEIAALAAGQGYDINGNYFDRDVDDLARRLERMLVAAGRTKLMGVAVLPSTTLLRQLQIIWIVLGMITLIVSIVPQLIPGLPGFFWLFPGSMTLAAFLWWLYWLGESMRPVRARASAA